MKWIFRFYSEWTNSIIGSLWTGVRFDNPPFSLLLAIPHFGLKSLRHSAQRLQNPRHDAHSAAGSRGFSDFCAAPHGRLWPLPENRL